MTVVASESVRRGEPACAELEGASAPCGAPQHGTSRRGATLSVTAAILAALSLAQPPVRAAEPPGAATPEALVARLRAGSERGDLAEVANCVTPAQRRQWSTALLKRGEVMVQFLGSGDGDGAKAPADAAAAALAVDSFKAKAEPARLDQSPDLVAFHAAVLVKHGLAARLAKGGIPSSEAAADALFAGVDEGALIADLTALTNSLVDPPRRDRPSPLPEVTDLAVKGDRAVADCGGCALELVRIGGRWYQQLPPKK